MPTPEPEPICLVVEDDLQVVELLTDILREHGFATIQTNRVADALAVLARRKPDVLLLDQNLPDGYGANVFERAVTLYPSLRSIMLTAFPSIQEAVRLAQMGLFKYLQKPFDLQELRKTLAELALQIRVERNLEGHHLVQASSPQMRRVLDALRMAAPYRHATVLLTGETGTGKEVCAKTLHDLTWTDHKPRPPFIPVNSAGIPDELLESELFGALPGSFTGAQRNRPGLVAAAEGGTLFLDEIGEMPLALQAKLLRFIETREYRQLGGTALKSFSGRIILATNRDLAHEVQLGRFREDLFHRINVLNIHLPPLRERPEDIVPLALHFVETICRQVGRPLLAIQPSDQRRLIRLPLPGNARALRNLIEKAVIQTPLNATTLSLQLDPDLFIPDEGILASRNFSDTVQPNPTSSPSFLEQIDAEALDQKVTRSDAAEIILIREGIRRHSGNLAQTAKWLGISRPALYRKLKRFNLSRSLN